ncbi:MAG: SDR family NAD(P)-dependent oxidoreductase [Candidatus Zixiibacteriota bacterium]|nr:MAG: SDR family NAD(P)-dependent oxidoreductase [candidate division Zixibacteria bacterium]
MSDSKPSVLITGANGFVGSHLCRRFSGEGFDVVAGIRRTADMSLIRDLPVAIRYGDVTDSSSLPAMVSEVDYIIHNAGVVKAKRPALFFEVNEAGTANLFEAILQNNPSVRRVVLVSSVAVAGPSEKGRPVVESDPPNPKTTYGRSKAAGERIALSYADRLSVVAVRPPAVYGPGDKEMFAFFRSVYMRIKPLIGNLSRRAQVVHADDLSAGIFAAATRELESGSVYFTAENRSYTIKEMSNILQQACGRYALPAVIPAPLFKLIARASETAFKMVGATPMLTREKSDELLASWEVSTDRAREELGFDSKIPFPQGAKETYDWYIREGWL